MPLTPEQIKFEKDWVDRWTKFSSSDHRDDSARLGLFTGALVIHESDSLRVAAA